MPTILSHPAVPLAVGAGLGRRPIASTSFTVAWAFLFLAAASHGVLDACTDGGTGVAFLWPWSNERFVAPARPIAVSPLSLDGLLSPRGAAVLASELRWVWLPCAVLAAVIATVRRIAG